MRSILTFISFFLLGLSFTIGLFLFFSPQGSGMFSGLGEALGIIVFAIGNLVSFLLNLVCWFRFREPRWIGYSAIVQLIPAIWCMLWLLGIGIDTWNEHRASDQRGAIYDAIVEDDPTAFAIAQAACSERCNGQYSADEQLVTAVEQGARQVAAFLVARGVKVKSGFAEAEGDVWSCEGSYEPGLNTLSIAVAKDDKSLVGLLLPVSDAVAQREAIWTAARFDRLDLVKKLASAGVPLSIRGKILDSNETLLVAAAEGAAIRVGRWLIEGQHFPVNAIENGPDPYPGRAPVEALMEFMSQTASAKVAEFMRMLVTHGADIDPDDSLLREAIRVGRKDEAELLLANGSSREGLDTEESRQLDVLLEGPDKLIYAETQREGCVAR